jgi:hypothetical protein
VVDRWWTGLMNLTQWWTIGGQLLLKPNEYSCRITLQLRCLWTWWLLYDIGLYNRVKALCSKPSQPSLE